MMSVAPKEEHSIFLSLFHPKEHLFFQPILLTPPFNYHYESRGDNSPPPCGMQC